MIQKLLALVPVLLVSCSQSPAPVAKVEPAQASSVPIVQLRGAAADIGATHGERLGDPIRTLFHAYFNQYFQNEAQRNMALAAAGVFEPKIDVDHRNEITALAASAHI